mgnify:CR=1 FL=1
MKKRIMDAQALERIRAIHQQSAEFNRLVKKPHDERLLELMRKHVEEIQELRNLGDPHYLVETGDLLILCYELLIEGGASIDEVTRQCFERYERKLAHLIEEAARHGQ